MHVLPFPQPQLGEKILPAGFAELPAARLLLELLDEIPQLEPAEEIRIGIGPLGMGRVGLLLAIGRPLARVLHFQGRGDDQHVGQAVLAVGLQDHPADPRIDGQAGELPAERRQPAVLVDRAQLEQRLVAVANRLGPRRIEKRKLVDRPQIERQKLQDHRGQVRPLNFRRREPLAAQEIFFAEQANADARPDAAAAPLALVGRGLRNRLDRQPLHFAAGRVAADAGRARIDDVANARHGERRLGDVRGQHDPPPAVRLEDAVLLGGRKAGIERQNLRLAAGQVAAAELVRRFQDVALGRQKDEHVARAEPAQLPRPRRPRRGCGSISSPSSSRTSGR